jgi:hypothetical protein
VGIHLDYVYAKMVMVLASVFLIDHGDCYMTALEFVVPVSPVWCRAAYIFLTPTETV